MQKDSGDIGAKNDIYMVFVHYKLMDRISIYETNMDTPIDLSDTLSAIFPSSNYTAPPNCPDNEKENEAPFEITSISKRRQCVILTLSRCKCRKSTARATTKNKLLICSVWFMLRKKEILDQLQMRLLINRSSLPEMYVVLSPCFIIAIFAFSWT